MSKVVLLNTSPRMIALCVESNVLNKLSIEYSSLFDSKGKYKAGLRYWEGHPVDNECEYINGVASQSVYSMILDIHDRFDEGYPYITNAGRILKGAANTYRDMECQVSHIACGESPEHVFIPTKMVYLCLRQASVIMRNIHSKDIKTAIGR